MGAGRGGDAGIPRRPRPLLLTLPASPLPPPQTTVWSRSPRRSGSQDTRWRREVSTGGGEMHARSDTAVCTHSQGSAWKLTPSQTLYGRALPRMQMLSPQRRAFRGDGEGRAHSGVRTGGWSGPPFALSQTADPHTLPSHCSCPFPPAGSRGHGVGPVPLILGRFSLADFLPTGPPSPSFASRILGDPKSLGRPLHWVLHPQPPGRPEPAASGHGGGSHCPQLLPQPAACKLGENSKPGSRAPPPGTACTPLPQPRGFGAAEPRLRPADARRDPPGHRPLRCAPAQRSRAGGQTEAEAARRDCAPGSTRSTGEEAAGG